MAKRHTILPAAAVGRLIEKSGAQRVSASAIKAMIELLEDYGTTISEQASKIAMHAGRKTVKDSDVKLASKMR